MGKARFSAAVVTVSDSAAAGKREDLSGPAVCRLLEEAGFDIRTRLVVPDDLDVIEKNLLEMCTGGAIDLVITTGGTGFGPRDVTPEATRRVIERQADNLVEFARASGCDNNPKAALSRGTAGIRGATLFVNLPGSPMAVKESLAALLTILPHALDLMTGGRPH